MIITRKKKAFLSVWLSSSVEVVRELRAKKKRSRSCYHAISSHLHIFTNKSIIEDSVISTSLNTHHYLLFAKCEYKSRVESKPILEYSACLLCVQKFCKILIIFMLPRIWKVFSESTSHFLLAMRRRITYHKRRPNR